MKKLYCIVQEGVYRHNIGGVFDTQKKAEKAAISLVNGEADHYHDWLIMGFNLNEAVDDGDLLCYAGHREEGGAKIRGRTNGNT